MNGFGALEWLARVGFLAKGVVYIVVGVLALQVAARAGGRVTGTRGALITVLGQPFGRTLLLLATMGLFGYAAWRVLQGVFDPDRLGRDWRSLGTRVGFVAGGVVHAALGWQAVRLYRGLSGPSGRSAEREVADEALRWPLGDWLILLAGIALIGFAVQQVYAAVTSRLERNLDIEQMQREAGAWTVSLSRFGVAARAVVFALLGWAIAVAGWSRDTSEVGQHHVIAPHPCRPTGSVGPVASRRDSGRFRRLRVLRNNPCALSTHPPRRLNRRRLRSGTQRIDTPSTQR